MAWNPTETFPGIIIGSGLMVNEFTLITSFEAHLFHENDCNLYDLF